MTIEKVEPCQATNSRENGTTPEKAVETAASAIRAGEGVAATNTNTTAAAAEKEKGRGLGGRHGQEGVSLRPVQGVLL